MYCALHRRQPLLKTKRHALFKGDASMPLSSQSRDYNVAIKGESHRCESSTQQQVVLMMQMLAMRSHPHMLYASMPAGLMSSIGIITARTHSASTLPRRVFVAHCIKTDWVRKRADVHIQMQRK